MFDSNSSKNKSQNKWTLHSQAASVCMTKPRLGRDA